MRAIGGLFGDAKVDVSWGYWELFGSYLEVICVAVVFWEWLFRGYLEGYFEVLGYW